MKDTEVLGENTMSSLFFIAVLCLYLLCSCYYELEYSLASIILIHELEYSLCVMIVVVLAIVLVSKFLEYDLALVHRLRPC